MNTPTSPDGGKTIVRTLGKEGLTLAEAREHDSYETHEIPADILDEPKSFTPRRYALICRDIAYFTSQVGRGSKRKMGDSPADPGSGMRRSSEGALYNLAHRTAILKRAAEADLIAPTNEDGFEAEEHELRFEITERGKWYLNHYFGPHIPVHKVARKQISRNSTALNKISTTIPAPDNPEAASGIKSYEEFKEQLDDTDPLNDPDTGTYHINPDRRIDSFPHNDPNGHPRETWIRQRDVPTQFDVTEIDGHVHLCTDLDAYKGDSYRETHHVSLTLGDNGDIYISETEERAEIEIPESVSGNAIRISGDYDPFVTSGAKDALTAAVDARYIEDYKYWSVDAEEGLVAVKAILETKEIDEVTTTATIVHEFTEHI